MNDHEAQRIAAAAHEMRPDWPAASVLTLIRKNLIAKPRRDVAVALAWVACESNTANPGRVLEGGPWWRAAGVEGNATPVPDKLDPLDTCAVCNKPRHVCTSTVGRDHEFESIVQHARALGDVGDDRDQLIAAARQAARDARTVETKPQPEPLLREDEYTREPEHTTTEEAPA